MMVRSSSSVCGRWLPSAMARSTSSSRTPAAWSSSITGGSTVAVGSGRVTSLVITHTVWPGRTSSRRRGVPMGAASDARTTFSPVGPLATGFACMTSITSSSGSSKPSVRVPMPTS